MSERTFDEVFARVVYWAIKSGAMLYIMEDNVKEYATFEDGVRIINSMTGRDVYEGVKACCDGLEDYRSDRFVELGVYAVSNMIPNAFKHGTCDDVMAQYTLVTSHSGSGRVMQSRMYDAAFKEYAPSKVVPLHSFWVAGIILAIVEHSSKNPEYYDDLMETLTTQAAISNGRDDVALCALVNNTYVSPGKLSARNLRVNCVMPVAHDLGTQGLEYMRLYGTGGMSLQAHAYVSVVGRELQAAFPNVNRSVSLLNSHNTLMLMAVKSIVAMARLSCGIASCMRASVHPSLDAFIQREDLDDMSTLPSKWVSYVLDTYRSDGSSDVSFEDNYDYIKNSSSLNEVIPWITQGWLRAWSAELGIDLSKCVTPSRVVGSVDIHVFCKDLDTLTLEGAIFLKMLVSRSIPGSTMEVDVMCEGVPSKAVLHNCSNVTDPGGHCLENMLSSTGGYTPSITSAVSHHSSFLELDDVRDFSSVATGIVSRYRLLEDAFRGGFVNPIRASLLAASSSDSRRKAQHEIGNLILGDPKAREALGVDGGSVPVVALRNMLSGSVDEALSIRAGLLSEWLSKYTNTDGNANKDNFKYTKTLIRSLTDLRYVLASEDTKLLSECMHVKVPCFAAHPATMSRFDSVPDVELECSRYEGVNGESASKSISAVAEALVVRSIRAEVAAEYCTFDSVVEMSSSISESIGKAGTSNTRRAGEAHQSCLHFHKKALSLGWIQTRPMEALRVLSNRYGSPAYMTRSENNKSRTWRSPVIWETANEGARIHAMAAGVVQAVAESSGSLDIDGLFRALHNLRLGVSMSMDALIGPSLHNIHVAIAPLDLEKVPAANEYLKQVRGLGLQSTAVIGHHGYLCNTGDLDKKALRIGSGKSTPSLVTVGRGFHVHGNETAAALSKSMSGGAGERYDFIEHGVTHDLLHNSPSPGTREGYRHVRSCSTTIVSAKTDGEDFRQEFMGSYVDPMNARKAHVENLLGKLRVGNVHVAGYKERVDLSDYRDGGIDSTDTLRSAMEPYMRLPEIPDNKFSDMSSLINAEFSTEDGSDSTVKVTVTGDNVFEVEGRVPEREDE